MHANKHLCTVMQYFIPRNGSDKKNHTNPWVSDRDVRLLKLRDKEYLGKVRL